MSNKNNHQNEVYITQGKRKREELYLPILYFPVADANKERRMGESWIETLGYRAFCAWLQLHTLVDRTDEAIVKYGNKNTIPRSLENLFKNIFNVSKPTFYNKIIKPLWNHSLIDIVEWEGQTKNGQKAMNIIVYHYPKNDKSLETKPLEKYRNYDTEYKSNGKIYGDIGGKLRSKQKDKFIPRIKFKNANLLKGKNNFTVHHTNVLLEKSSTSNRKKNLTVTVKKIKPINNTNTLFNKTNILDTLKDTSLTNQFLDELNNNPMLKKEAQQEMLKDSLKDNLPESIHKTLSVFSNDFKQMYEWVGIILRAKKEVESNYGFLITFEQYDEDINKILMSGIRKIKTDHTIKKPNNYLFITMRDGLARMVTQIDRQNINEDNYYNWLEDGEE